MKLVLSPAMTMNSVINDIEGTKPVFLEKANLIAKRIKELDILELEKMLNVSPKLAEKVFENYLKFNLEIYDHKCETALYAFDGLAYKNINCWNFSHDDINFAQDTVRILSALYGIIRPLDNIQKYRLDFLCNFGKTGINNENLYKFWSDSVYNELFKSDEYIIGLCSKEYERLITKYLKPHDKYIYCNFLTTKNGVLKTITTDAKAARGQMTRFIIKNRIDNINDLKNFTELGYKFCEHSSTNRMYNFIKEKD